MSHSAGCGGCWATAGPDWDALSPTTREMILKDQAEHEADVHKGKPQNVWQSASADVSS